MADIEKILDFLHTPFVDNKLVFLDWFSFGHLIFGFVTMLIIMKLISYLPLAIIVSFIILVLWEFFEVYAASSKRFFIRPDKPANSMWDIIIGGIGIYLAILLQ